MFRYFVAAEISIYDRWCPHMHHSLSDRNALNSKEKNSDQIGICPWSASACKGRLYLFSYIVLAAHRYKKLPFIVFHNITIWLPRLREENNLAHTLLSIILHMTLLSCSHPKMSTYSTIYTIMLEPGCTFEHRSASARRTSVPRLACA